MTVTFDSKSEAKLAPKIALLGGTRCDSFAPLLPSTFTDAAGEELQSKPDSLIRRGGGFTFLDTKSGSLNFHPSRASSHAALKRAYGEVFRRYGDHLSHSQLSTALYEHSERGRIEARAHAFNNSAFKLAAIQAKHGFQRFLVVFERKPTSHEAERYCQAGLVFCTINTLPDMLQVIELLRHGIAIPFNFAGKGYSFTVTADMSNRKLPAAEVEFIDRGRFESAVTADQATIAARQAKDDAEWEGGLRPF